jgi:hypothetical protein
MILQSWRALRRKARLNDPVAVEKKKRSGTVLLAEEEDFFSWTGESRAKRE